MILLFDLDGTLTDPRRGIVGSTRHAFERLGLEPPPEDLVASFIGPPLRGMFATLLARSAPGRVEEAVLHYRERYRDVGIFETTMYPGVREMLERARSFALRVYLATSKPWMFAERILEHLSLAAYFDGVHGPELDGRFDDKGVLIARMLERERFDGGDVAHILRASAERIDWPRLVARFGDYWRVLMVHLVMFGFVYPCERHRVPPGVLSELWTRLQRELGTPEAGQRVCRGTVLSRAQYLVDVERWGYVDPRLAPHGNLTEREAEIWTAGIADDGPPETVRAA